MASWEDVVAAVPDLSAAARALLDVQRHKVLATLRADGSPRVSGIEMGFDRGQAWIGSMPGALKARDLQRDPRFALHSAAVSPPGDPQDWPGDAKLAGVALAVTDDELRSSLLGAEHADADAFVLDITEVVVVRVGSPPDHLDLWSWRSDRGERRVRRT